MHVELENFFQKIWRHDLLLQFSGCARLFGRLLRLLFEFNAFETQQILGPLDRIFQRAVRVVEHGALFQAEGTFFGVRLREQVGMEPAAQRVEFLFELGRVQVELAWKSKESEIVDWDGRLNFPHELQNCAARVVPHDQQLAVASLGPCPGMISDDLDSAFAIQNLGRARGPPSTGETPVSPLNSYFTSRVTSHYEKELPQPQDLVEFGFTKTKPCCIRVSW